MQNNEINFTIKKTNNNGYERFRVQKTINGQKINVVGKSRKEVTTKFYQKLRELSSTNSTGVDVSNISFSDFVKYYLYEVVEPSKSIKESTFRSYEFMYTVHIKDSVFSNVKLKNMNREPIQIFVNSLISKDLKISTVRVIKTFVSTVLNYAVAGDLIQKNYCTFVKLPKEENEKRKNKFLTDEEIKALLDNCNDYKLKTLIILILNTGLRINEALALTLKDIDFENQCIIVNKNLQYSKKGMIVGSTKSKTSNRVIPLNPSLAKVLKGYILKSKEERFKIGVTVGDDSFLFVTKRNTFVNSRSFMYGMNKLFKKCNIEVQGFHVLRHTFGSKLYQNRVDIKTISELLGHANISVTSDIYVHLSPNSKKDAVGSLNFA